MPDPTQQIDFLASAADLGRAIQAARKRSGETQQALARRCRVGRRFVLELEAGKPSVRLDKALQVMYAVGLTGILVPIAVIQAALGK
jgi:HTH-type transcriptional regulator/antitoxin HipB